ncbi:MAG: hypothetical protein MJ178_10605 [Treponemataceae bacterium]|nr:hypothetical protein [Treponemataceae bacterium]
MKRLLLTAAAIVLAATTLSAQVLGKTYIRNVDVKPFFGYLEEFADDYYRNQGDCTKGDLFYHKFGDNQDIVTGCIINGISLTKNFTFEEAQYIGDKKYYNVLAGWYDDSYNSHGDHDFRWFDFVDEDNPHEMICETVDWNIQEELVLHAWVDFDSSRRLTHVKTDDGVEIWVTYSKGGKIASYKDTYGQNFVFSADGKLTSATYADGHTETITWNKRGYEDTRTYSDGRSYSNAYDSRNRLITRTWNDGVVIHYEYDNRGRLCHQYTEYAGCTAALDEMTCEWDNTGKIGTETHSDGRKYIVITDPWSPSEYSRYRMVDTDTLNQKTVAEIPDDPYMFESTTWINQYAIFADGSDIYLSGSKNEMQDYILSDGNLKQANLPVFSVLTQGDTICIERCGDYILGLHDIYYKTFDTPVQLDYTIPDDIRYEMYKVGAYGEVIYSARYVVPKGIVFHNNWGGTDDNWIAIEYNGAEAVKFIPRDQIEQWLADQEGNFTLSPYSLYNYSLHYLCKDGKIYQRNMPVGTEQYQNGVGKYVGSINGQYSIFEVYNDTYGIFDGTGKLVRYFKLPFGDNVKWTVDFAENGKLYAAVTPEFETVRITSWDDYYDEYHPAEGSKGKIVELVGHLNTFGYLNTDNVKITRTPQAKGAAIGTFDHDTTFEVLSQQTVTVNKKGATEDWSEIRLSDGTIGWVKSQYVSRF